MRFVTLYRLQIAAQIQIDENSSKQNIVILYPLHDVLSYSRIEE